MWNNRPYNLARNKVWENIIVNNMNMITPGQILILSNDETIIKQG